MTPIGLIFTLVGIALVLACAIALVLVSSRGQREASIQYRTMDAKRQISDICSDAADKMARRAGVQDVFHLGTYRSKRW